MSVAGAIRTGDLSQLPSRRDEDWRWSDMRGLIRVLPPASPAHEGALAAGPFDGLADDDVAIVNGRGVESIAVASAGRAIALRFVSTADAGAHAAHLAIDVGPGATLVLLESYESQARDYVVEADLTIRLAADARLERVVLAADGPDGVSVSRADVTLAAGSSVTQTVLTSGAKRQRIETRISHPGAGASVRLDGLYLLAGRRHADITTLVTHQGVDGKTDQLTKGVVREQARGVFQGRIVVAEGADQTDAKMRHDALILSDRAEIDAKPELEIYADEVSCAHGNTVGALDEDALFYALQRGIPEAEARAMLTGAFVDEVVDRIAHEGARGIAEAWVIAQSGVSS